MYGGWKKKHGRAKESSAHRRWRREKAAANNAPPGAMPAPVPAHVQGQPGAMPAPAPAPAPPQAVVPQPGAMPAPALVEFDPAMPELEIDEDIEIDEPEPEPPEPFFYGSGEVDSLKNLATRAAAKLVVRPLKELAARAAVGVSLENIHKNTITAEYKKISSRGQRPRWKYGCEMEYQYMFRSKI